MGIQMYIYSLSTKIQKEESFVCHIKYLPFITIKVLLETIYKCVVIIIKK